MTAVHFAGLTIGNPAPSLGLAAWSETGIRSHDGEAVALQPRTGYQRPHEFDHGQLMSLPARRGGRLALLLAFLLAFGFTGFHVVRTARDAIYWRQHRDEPIQGWMTLGFVAHSYHVPPYILPMALGLPAGPPPDRRPLAKIAQAQGRSLDQATAILHNAIVHARPPYPPPPPPPKPSR